MIPVYLTSIIAPDNWHDSRSVALPMIDFAESLLQSRAHVRTILFKMCLD